MVVDPGFQSYWLTRKNDLSIRITVRNNLRKAANMVKVDLGIPPEFGQEVRHQWTGGFLRAVWSSVFKLVSSGNRLRPSIAIAAASESRPRET